ncbi:MAG: RNA 2',3'-cyclic phosphodiesterase [Gammaproteobacteria bacterium]|nr:RNA 2',3'-cyclic phosphodiesterase [Gammaproteobacteria bacterium]
MRLFFALWPEDDVRAALAAAAGALALRAGRLEPAARLHLTLRFLGDVADAQLDRWRAAASEVMAPAFNLHLTQVGWWPQSAVAWLAPSDTPAELTALATALACIDLPAARAEHAFRPHVTLARRVRHAPGLARRLDVCWPVASFALVSSQPTRDGSRYEVLARWPLAQGEPGSVTRLLCNNPGR